MVEHQTMTMAEALLPLFILATLALLLRLGMVHQALEQERRAHAEASKRCRQLEQDRQPDWSRGPHRPRTGEYVVRRSTDYSGRWWARHEAPGGRYAYGYTPLEALEQLLDLEEAARRPS